MPSFHDFVVEFLLQVQGFNTVVHDAYSYVRQDYACFDRKVYVESFRGLSFCDQTFVHLLVHILLDEAFVSVSPFWITATLFYHT